MRALLLRLRCALGFHDWHRLPGWPVTPFFMSDYCARCGRKFGDVTWFGDL